jgi:hypothetical protein
MNYLKKYYAPDTTVGVRLELDANDGINSMKELKKQIKDAQLEVIQMQEKFGETSKEAINAAKRVNELKDRIKDANEVVDLFDPGKKFQAATNAINGLVGGFTALTGAMGLLGVESENVQKQILKVQSALALSQGLSTIADSAKDFKRLGDTIVNTLGKGGAIGLAIAGVAALGVAIWNSVTGAEKLTEKQKTLNDVNAEAAKIYAQERMELEKNVRVLNNENTPRAEKISVIKKLQDQYPQYFNNLKLEGNQVTGLTEGYAKLIRVMELKARAAAASNLLQKQEQELLEKGFELGITTEEQGLKLLNALENSTGEYDGLLAAKGREILNRRNFLKKIITETDEEIKKLDGKKQIVQGGGKGTKTDQKEDNINIRGIDPVAQVLAAEREAERQRLEETKARRFEDLDNARLIDAGKIESMRQVTMSEEQMALARIEIAERERAAKINAAMAIGSALGTLADLVGKQTAAGKVLGIAQATINTFIGATEVLRAKSTLPEPFGTIAKIANVAAIIASGIAAVKNIVKVQVPGAGSGGGASIPSAQAATAPLQPQNVAQRTRLDADQLNQIGNATVRAFVVESDVTGSQQRIRRLNRAARI